MQHNNNKFTVTVLFISTLGANTANAQSIINNYKKLHIVALIAMGATDIKRMEFTTTGWQGGLSQPWISLQLGADRDDPHPFLVHLADELDRLGLAYTVHTDS
jgi:hypothetical protein